jgi:hypothetical protein
MKLKIIATVAAVLCCALVAHAQTPLTLQISNGRVTLHAQNVPVRTILAEWARVGGAKILNGDRVAGAPLTLDLESVSERQALDIVLRGVSGYVVAAREAGASGASMYDRIMILPTSAAPRNPAPVGAPTAFQTGPGGIVRPIVPRPAAGIQNGDDDTDATAVNPPSDGIPLGRPVPIPRAIPGGPITPQVMTPPVAVAPDNEPPQPQQPGVVVATPSNPFGLPPGSSARPGVITPPPQPLPQGAAPRPQD